MPEVHSGHYGWGLSSAGQSVGTLPSQYNAQGEASAAGAAGASNSGNALAIEAMLNQYHELQQQTMMENMEMQKAQAFCNPLESMPKRDATS